MLKSIRGITEKDFKKLSDGELEAMCLYRESIGRSTKYWEITNDDLVGKAIASTEPIENLADKRFTAMAAAAYYRQTSGQPLKQTTLVANAKKYGFVIKERGSGLYALLDP